MIYFCTTCPLFLLKFIFKCFDLNDDNQMVIGRQLKVLQWWGAVWEKLISWNKISHNNIVRVWSILEYRMQRRNKPVKSCSAHIYLKPISDQRQRWVDESHHSKSYTLRGSIYSTRGHVPPHRLFQNQSGLTLDPSTRNHRITLTRVFLTLSYRAILSALWEPVYLNLPPLNPVFPPPKSCGWHQH